MNRTEDRPCGANGAAPAPAVAGADLDAASALGEAEVHVWTVHVDAHSDSMEADLAILCPEEQLAASRFRFALDRIRFVRRRAALRSILGRYLGIAPRDIAYGANTYGKPTLIDRRAVGKLSFNTSHSAAAALIAVSRCALLGVDIEQLRPMPDDMGIAARFFAPPEAAALAELQCGDRIDGFFHAWTRKEAVVKALGSGLSIPLDAFAVSLRPGDPPRILACRFDPQLVRTLRLAHLALGGYVGAVAAGPGEYRLRLGVHTR